MAGLPGGVVVEIFNFFGSAFDFDGDAGGSIGDETGEGALISQAVDERTETYTLDNAGNVDSFAEKGHG